MGRFMAEHEDIINHLTALRNAPDEAGRSAAADAMAHALWPHTDAEETGLFSVLARDELFTDHIASLCAEHVEIGERLAQVREGEPGAFESFEKLLREHIDREDNGLFPASAIHLNGDDWEEVVSLTPPRS
ncbi:hypothetical protein N802_06265 [Knoellia sinensis KCTC 19936]|uniref:Hemerythrin-like domain-containing protein n=1 Tax=Knoellia sinensis KCTC 19936 TaxID=1385520 RepID=A0A0A0J038_9MICO|nr:hypothetical protein N802_06265 [Knoellia sinensis KCTC 19936]